MKVFISVDMEGISGIVDGSMTGWDKHDYGRGRALMVADVNAAIEGSSMCIRMRRSWCATLTGV